MSIKETGYTTYEDKLTATQLLAFLLKLKEYHNLDKIEISYKISIKLD